MRILYWAPQPGVFSGNISGNGPHIRGTIAGLERMGHSVLPIFGGDLFLDSLGARSASSSLFRRRRLITGLLPPALRNDLRVLWLNPQVMKWARRASASFGPDLVYERTAYLNGDGPRLAWELNVPYVLESDAAVEMTSYEDGSMLAWLARRIERRKHAEASTFVVSSSHAREVISRRYGIGPDRIFVKGLGVDPVRFDPASTDRSRWRQRLGLSPATVVGYVGSFRRHHRVDIVIEAAQILKDSASSPVKFLLVGGEGSKDRLLQECKRRGLDNVVFTGTVADEELPYLLAAMDIAVAPGAERHILYPIKLIEYGAMGLPVLVPDLPVFEEVIVDGDTGLTFKNGSVESFLQSLSELTGNEGLRRRLGETLRSRILNEYTWDQVAGRVSHALDRAMSSFSPRREEA